MLSRSQQIMIKRAQAQAGLDDPDYRDALETVSGIPGLRSSKDPRLTDSHVDRIMAYFEAIYWRAVDSGTLQPPCNGQAVFRQRAFWSSRNPAGNTTRDRYASRDLAGQIANAEAKLAALGFNSQYCESIRRRVPTDRSYLAALRRTLRFKSRTLPPVLAPSRL